MTYSRRINSLRPALIIVLVDQSESMTETIPPGPMTKAQAVADQINTLVYELVLRCVKTPKEPPKPYFFVSVIGYSTTPLGEPVVHSALPGSSEGSVSTTDLADGPLRILSRIGAAGGTIRTPVWVEPVGRGGTPMCAAFDRAGQLAAAWVARCPDSFPPVVINLSDGEATDGDPAVWAERLRRLSTSNGHVLLFNLHLSASSGAATLFPASTEVLADSYAHTLFHMSSPLPDSMIDIARSHGIATRPGARGFAFNADIKALASFVNVGTSMGRVAG